MALFSQRKGLTPLAKILQVESVDEDLTNALWNCLWINFFGRWDRKHPVHGYTSESVRVMVLSSDIWTEHFRQAVDEMPNWVDCFAKFKTQFYCGSWFQKLDFLEFVAKHSDSLDRDQFIADCNKAFERENSAYRFINREIVEISSPSEIASVEEALSCGIRGVEIHLSAAISHLSNKANPDYRNSIKESISAVETACRVIADEPKMVLTSALRKLSASSPIHPAFADALVKLYGFTSDGQGIRHSLLDEPTLKHSDAKFMLVACSAFVGFLISKATENGVPVKTS